MANGVWPRCNRVGVGAVAESKRNMEISFIDKFEEWHFDRMVCIGGEGVETTVVARVGIVDDEGWRFLVNVFSNAGTSPFQDARSVGHIAYIGYGEYLFVLDTKTSLLARHRLDGYFGHMYDSDDFEYLPSKFSVLVTSASETLAFSRNGELVWTQPNLGIDGVVVHAVDERRIDGEGEFDPPGGWRKFTLSWAPGAAD